MNAKLRHCATLAALTILPATGRAEWLDYAQADTSSAATTVVLVRAVGAAGGANPAPLVSATYTRWSTGEAGAVGYVYRWPLAGETHHWVVGAGAGANLFRTRDEGNEQNQSALSARLQSEWYGPAPGGTYYALAQASSFRGSWLATAQYSPAGLPVSAEWTRYHERGYQATSLGIRIAMPVARWFLRLGVTHAEDESRPYIGIAYNGF